jgi:phosphocarrier protein
MPERSAIIASSVGLHARPAAVFVQAVMETGISVTLTCERRSVNASSLLAVLSLGIGREQLVTLSADGAETGPALDSLVDILQTDFDQK